MTARQIDFYGQEVWMGHAHSNAPSRSGPWIAALLRAPAGYDADQNRPNIEMKNH
jgi:hypothetical protein